MGLFVLKSGLRELIWAKVLFKIRGENWLGPGIQEIRIYY